MLARRAFRISQLQWFPTTSIGQPAGRQVFPDALVIPLHPMDTWCSFWQGPEALTNTFCPDLRIREK